MKARLRTKYISEIKKVIRANDNTFVNVDIGDFYGTICIRDKNPKFPDIMSQIAVIDNLMGDLLDADILDMNIAVNFIDGDQDIYVVITFNFD